VSDGKNCAKRGGSSTDRIGSLHFGQRGAVMLFLHGIDAVTELLIDSGGAAI